MTAAYPVTVIDGAHIPTEKAAVAVTDAGLQRGDGAFEVVRVYGGRAFALADHLSRLAASARTLRLDIDVEPLAGEVARAIRVNDAADALVRILLTRGGRRIVIVERLPALSPVIRLAVLPHAPHPLLREAKSLSYAAHMLATRLAQERGFDDALLVDAAGNVLELARSALFWVRDGRVHAPPLELGILDSITRRRVFELADATEARSSLDDLRGAEQVFSADTVAELTPVVEVEGVGTFPAGGVAEALRLRLRERIVAELAS